jgi:hypothetical protein
MLQAKTKVKPWVEKPSILLTPSAPGLLALFTVVVQTAGKNTYKSCFLIIKVYIYLDINASSKNKH